MVERVVSFALVLACVTVVGLAEEPAVEEPWLAAGFTEDGRTQVRAAIQEVIDGMPTHRYAARTTMVRRHACRAPVREGE
jgi:hypothetical protein